jgi:hypothetical protein
MPQDKDNQEVSGSTERMTFAKEWTSHTMTSLNYVRISNTWIHYGVDSQDDDQAFYAYCLVNEFLDREPEYWAKANFSEREHQEICEAIKNMVSK